MQDSLDKAILWQLLDGPVTTWEIGRKILAKGGEKETEATLKKLVARIKYRLGLMVDEGFVVHDKKTKKYGLENVTMGEGVLKLKKEGGGEEEVELGLTVLACLEDVVKIVFMEELF